jgi:S-methylmethionine-dependent homocysteine/selenocysteine methylase
MAKYRAHLPQLENRLFLTDGGIETTLIYRDGFELPLFAAFHLLREKPGVEALRSYYKRHASVAIGSSVGFILESATWRASADWAARLGYTSETLSVVNRTAIDLLHELRSELETDASPMVISGCVGPRGDGYRPEALMTADEAEAYHRPQLQVFERADVDLATAITMTNTAEAIGITRAARAEGLPVVISFTVETDGRLPTGQSLDEAIDAVDRATKSGPAYYMINCAHPTHFAHALIPGAGWVGRIRGVRANASACSHAELDRATALDDGDPVALGEQYRDLRARCPQLTVLGGCCGTDERHVRQICEQCLVDAEMP